MSNEKVAAGDVVVSGVERGAHSEDHSASAPCFIADFECLGADGRPKWKSRMHNVVMLEGKSELLNRFFGQKANALWYMGLASSNAAGSTTNVSARLSDLGGSEVTGYGASRAAITFANNYATGVLSASQTAQYAITVAGPVNVGGAFICAAQSTSATATSAGIIYSFGTFASRALISLDSLNVTVTVSFA